MSVGLQSFVTPGVPHTGEVKIAIANTFVHEFAHAIYYAIRMIDPTFDARLVAAYEEAVENNYTFSSPAHEHWAVAATNWFRLFPKVEWEYNRFRERNPLMHALMEEWFDLKDLWYVESEPNFKF